MSVYLLAFSLFSLIIPRRFLCPLVLNPYPQNGLYRIFVAGVGCCCHRRWNRYVNSLSRHVLTFPQLTSFAGGLCAAISLRRAGHKVTIYERADFAGEVGASISCAANGTRWLETWDVPTAEGRPVILKKLISHDWATGEDVNIYDLADYKEKWGYVSVELGVVRGGEVLTENRSTTCSTESTCTPCS